MRVDRVLLGDLKVRQPPGRPLIGVQGWLPVFPPPARRSRAAGQVSGESELFRLDRRATAAEMTAMATISKPKGTILHDQPPPRSASVQTARIPSTTPRNAAFIKAWREFTIERGI